MGDRSRRHFIRTAPLFCLGAFLLLSQVWANEGVEEVRAAPELRDKSQQQNRAHISFDSTYCDVGEVWENDEIVHTFEIRNTGTELLTINKVESG